MTAISPHSILVVEDSDEDFDIVEEAARMSGPTNLIRRARTGDACMAMLRGYPLTILTMSMSFLEDKVRDEGQSTIQAHLDN